MKNIILPTDFSENAWNAIAYAAQLFKNEKCVFHLLNSYQLPPYGSDYTAPEPSAAMQLESIKEASIVGLEKVKERIDKELSTPNHTVSQISSFNTLTVAMEELHDQHDIDYIVMGTKGATGAEKILFGSNTVRVLNNAKAPVLAIPDNFDFKAPREILFPSDYDITFKQSHITPILDIATQYESVVNSLHVYKDVKLTEKQLDNRNEMEELFKQVTLKLHHEKDQKIPKAIDNFLSKEDITLLVMINNKHTFFENLFFKNKINEIGFNLNVPFLVIPSIAS